MSILTLFVVTPVLTLFGLWLARNIRQVRGATVAGSTALLALSVWLTIAFIQMHQTGNTEATLFMYSAPWFKPLSVAYTVGVDSISVVMLFLPSIIVSTGTFASWQLKPMTKKRFLWFTLLSTGMFGFSIFIDLFIMPMFYGVTLIPMYLLIGVWGSGPKEYTAMKLTLMLMGGSALLIIGILGIYLCSGATTMNVLETTALYNIPVDVQKIFFPSIFIGFGVLGVLFPSHAWSPDGHASVPTAASMLYSDVLIKLRGYGCFRIAMLLLPKAAQELAWIFLILTTISVVYDALSACIQTNLKYINAYSSVSHCGLVLLVLLITIKTAYTGAILQVFSHGLITALFFALIGMICGRTHTCDVRQLGGLMKVMSLLGVGYVVTSLANLGLPGLSGFVTEMIIFIGSFANNDTFHRAATIIACTSIVITAVYILRVVGKILYQEVANPHFEQLTDATWDEHMAVMCLIFYVADLGIAPLWTSSVINDVVGPILLNIIH